MKTKPPRVTYKPTPSDELEGPDVYRFINRKGVTVTTDRTTALNAIQNGLIIRDPLSPAMVELTKRYKKFGHDVIDIQQKRFKYDPLKHNNPNINNKPL